MLESEFKKNDPKKEGNDPSGKNNVPRKLQFILKGITADKN